NRDDPTVLEREVDAIRLDRSRWTNGVLQCPRPDSPTVGCAKRQHTARGCCGDEPSACPKKRSLHVVDERRGPPDGAGVVVQRGYLFFVDDEDESLPGGGLKSRRRLGDPQQRAVADVVCGDAVSGYREVPAIASKRRRCHEVVVQVEIPRGRRGQEREVG